LPGAKSPEGRPRIPGRKNKKADLRRPFYCVKTSGLLLHCVSRCGRSRSSRSSGRSFSRSGSRSGSRCGSRSGGRCSSFSSLLATGGQSESQQGGNKSDTFHFVFLGRLKLKNINNLPGFKCIHHHKGSAPKIKGRNSISYIGEVQRIFSFLCYNPSLVEDMA
jgi:hypothetical protein